MKIYIFTLLLLLIIGCTTSYNKLPDIYIPNEPNPSREQVQISLPENVDIEVVDYNLPEGYDEEEDTLSNENPIENVNNSVIKYTITPTSKDFSGGSVVYNYTPNFIYKIYLKPFNATDIKLQPGEVIVSSPVCGDTVNFILGTGISYENNIEVTHVYIKPVYEKKSTNLIINTNKRTYQFSLYSFDEDEIFMPMVSFNYPIESFEMMQSEANRLDNEIFLAGNLSNFDFAYEIVPHSIFKPDWCPNIVFSDGVKTYLHFASARQASYAPVLFLVKDNERILVNYRVIGDYYVVDMANVEHMELVVDINNGNIITIKKVR